MTYRNAEEAIQAADRYVEETRRMWKERPQSAAWGYFLELALVSSLKRVTPADGRASVELWNPKQRKAMDAALILREAMALQAKAAKRLDIEKPKIMMERDRTAEALQEEMRRCL